MAEYFSLKNARHVVDDIWYVPHYSEYMGHYMGPEVESVVPLIAKDQGWFVGRTGAALANMYGVSLQVPARYVFYSSGPDCTKQIGGFTVEFVHKDSEAIKLTGSFAYDFYWICELYSGRLHQDDKDRLLLSIKRYFLPNKREILEALEGLDLYQYIKDLLEEASDLPSQTT